MSIEQDIITAVSIGKAAYDGVRDIIELVRGKAPAGDIARRAVGLGLDLVPVEELRGYLHEESQRRANAIADAAEAAKFGR